MKILFLASQRASSQRSLVLDELSESQMRAEEAEQRPVRRPRRRRPGQLVVDEQTCVDDETQKDWIERYEWV